MIPVCHTFRHRVPQTLCDSQFTFCPWCLNAFPIVCVCVGGMSVCAVCMHDLFSRYAAALAPLLFIDRLKPIKKCRHCKTVVRQLKPSQ